jgi:hypothetical protein
MRGRTAFTVISLRVGEVMLTNIGGVAIGKPERARATRNA